MDKMLTREELEKRIAEYNMYEKLQKPYVRTL